MLENFFAFSFRLLCHYHGFSRTRKMIDLQKCFCWNTPFCKLPYCGKVNNYEKFWFVVLLEISCLLGEHRFFILAFFLALQTWFLENCKRVIKTCISRSSKWSFYFRELFEQKISICDCFCGNLGSLSMPKLSFFYWLTSIMKFLHYIMLCLTSAMIIPSSSFTRVEDCVIKNSLLLVIASEI